MTQPSAKTAPEFSGGRLPVNAEKIEACLNEIWQSQSEDSSDETPPMHLCLANVLIVCDAASRKDAERLVHNIATIQPSRVLNIVIDDEIDDYAACVSTACNLSPHSVSTVCWESIMIESDSNRAERIPGAIRSLLIDSVPVITIDFRLLQTQPLFDSTVIELSDYYFVKAEIVPTGRLNRNFLPLRWYHTLPVRELLSDFFYAVQEHFCKRYPIEFTFTPGILPDRLDVLVGGWLCHRLGKLEYCSKQQDGVVVSREPYPVRLRWAPSGADNAPALSIRFDDDSLASMSVDGEGTMKSYTMRYCSRTVSRRQDDELLARYIVEATRDPVEFREYRAVREVVRQTAIG